MLSDFSTISPVWIRYCITDINMESIERNGLYDQILDTCLVLSMVSGFSPEVTMGGRL